jgi:protein phosphatase
MNLHSFGLSDIGLSRSNNEDVWIAIPEIGFFALADGMGGHQAGEIAAREAIDHLTSSVKGMKVKSASEWTRWLRSAIEKANHWVYNLGNEDDSLQGMGTTLCCLLWSQEAIVYAHVGDSRIYRFRERKLELLTQDHSLFAKWLELGKSSKTPFPYKNVITRAVGTHPKANPEVALVPHLPGDLFFLCSDGLTDVLSLEEIETLMISTPNLEKAAKILIEKAKFKGSSDNITILMVQSETDNGKNLSRQQRNNPSRSEGVQSDAARSQLHSSEPL